MGSQKNIHTEKIIAWMRGTKHTNNFLGGEFLGQLVQIRQHIQVLLGKGCSQPNSIWGGMFGPVEREFGLAIFKIKISSPSEPNDYLKETRIKPFKRLRIRCK